MSTGDASGRFVANQKFSVTCAADGGSFTDAPTDWGSCTDVSGQQCTGIAPDGSKGYDTTVAPADAALGATSTVSCATNGHVVSGTSSADLTLTCEAEADDANSPYYKLVFTPAHADWPACEAPAKKRKKRASSSGYNYILIDLETQFMGDSANNFATEAEFRAFLATLGNDTGTLDGKLGSLIIDVSCPDDVCGLQTSNNDQSFA